MTQLDRFVPTLLITLGLGCASSTQSTETPQNPAPHEPSSGQGASDTPTDSTPTDSTPASSASGEGGGKSEGSEAQWEGEKDAVSKPVARTAEETRTTEVIQKVVVDNRAAVRDCYDRGRKELPDLKGTMIIKFTLDPEGHVKKAELNMDGSTIKAPAIVNCSIDAIKRIKFPASSRGMDTTVNYPFDFKPDGGGRPK
jgi:hypothetical protein